MKKLPFLFILVCLLGLSSFAIAQDTPEEQGISSRSIVKFIEALEKAQPDAIHSVMIRRHGLIVSQGWWAPYAPETPHLLWSLSKSFTSTAIGLAQDEGLLSVDDLVISFFPEDIPEKPSANLKAMRISDLLRMNTGQAVEPGFRNMQSDNWVSAFLAHKVDYKPGTHFKYNSMATYMCSAILQKVTGMTMVDYLTPRLFEPLGIQKPSWESDPKGINVGGWGLSVRTEDISKLGQLYLQKGKWEGKQLLSEAWVEAATSNQTSNGSNPDSDWDQGYGYQFWQCRYNAYRGDGAFGQYCLVMPEQDAVIAITAGSDDLQGILDVVWEHLLPAMKEGTLPPDEAGLELLHQKQQGLAIAYVAGEESSPLALDISGKVYHFEENIRLIKSISFNFESSPVDITINTDQGERTISAAFSSMEKGILPNPQLVSDKVAANGAWESPDTYVLNLIYYETPQSTKCTFTFKEKSLLWDTEYKASFGSRRARPLKGTL